jgi:hypothetical protein
MSLNSKHSPPHPFLSNILNISPSRRIRNQVSYPRGDIKKIGRQRNTEPKAEQAMIHAATGHLYVAPFAWKVGPNGVVNTAGNRKEIRLLCPLHDAILHDLLTHSSMTPKHKRTHDLKSSGAQRLLHIRESIPSTPSNYSLLYFRFIGYAAVRKAARLHGGSV